MLFWLSCKHIQDCQKTKPTAFHNSCSLHQDVDKFLRFLSIERQFRRETNHRNTSQCIIHDRYVSDDRQQETMKLLITKLDYITNYLVQVTHGQSLFLLNDVSTSFSLKMTTAKVVVTSVNIKNNSPSQDYTNLDDLHLQICNDTPSLKLFTLLRNVFPLKLGASVGVIFGSFGKFIQISVLNSILNSIKEYIIQNSQFIVSNCFKHIQTKSLITVKVLNQSRVELRRPPK